MNKTREHGHPLRFACYALYKCEFGDVWVNQGVGDEGISKGIQGIAIQTRMEQQFKNQRTFCHLQYFQVVLIPGTVPE